MPRTSIAAWLAIALITGGCTASRIGAGATEATLCRLWGESLPTRSHADTAQTRAQIGAAYADFAAACPDQAGLIP